MRVRQCPKCELRFLDDNEVKQHLVDEHHVEPENLERHVLGYREGVHPHRDAPQPRPGSTSP